MKPLIPVLTLECLERLDDLAELLLKHRLLCVEVTLRNRQGLTAIREFTQHPGLEVWAGSVCTPEQAEQALKAGAVKLVSPGSPLYLQQEITRLQADWLPGVQTASEVMALLERGYVQQKFFPAMAAGDLSWLQAMSGPLAEVSFCPTGGIDMLEVGHFLAQKNVFALGLSRLVPSEPLSHTDIHTLDAKLALRLGHLRELEHEQ